MREVLERTPAVPWFEVHSENYFADGGPSIGSLLRIRADYPVALHGVGLSLGSTDALDEDHLRKLGRLVDRVEPAVVKLNDEAQEFRWVTPAEALNMAINAPTRRLLEAVAHR